METARKVIDVAFSMKMWVFGGYVRDVIVRGKKSFNDIDICCPRGSDPRDFFRVLSTHVTVNNVREKPITTYKRMSKGIMRIFRCNVNNAFDIDIVVFDGNMGTWLDEESTDFTCNIFYHSREVYLGLRYVPRMYRHAANPMRQLVTMTRKGIFFRIWNGTEPVHIFQIANRVRSLVERGFTFKGKLLTDLMHVSLYGNPFITNICDVINDEVRNLQREREFHTLLKCTKRLNISLPEDVNRQILEFLD